MRDFMKQLHDKVYNKFSSVASSLGYSEVHGRILSALIIANRPLSMDELSKITGYSSASISLSLDFLELVGIVKKFKKKGDRKIYSRLDGDLLEGLRKAILFKLQKEIVRTLDELSVIKRSNNKKTIQLLEKELKRLEEYVIRLSKVPIPKR